MKRFKLHSSRLRDIKPKFIYYTAEQGECIKVTVTYRMGGMNYSTYKTDPRGYYLSIQPMKVEVSNGMRCETFTGFSGKYVFIELADRFNAKRMTHLTETIEPFLDKIVELWNAGQHDEIANLWTLEIAPKL
jgi:hypothetical protein